MNSARIALVAAAVAFWGVACGENAPVVEPPPTLVVMLTPANHTIGVGGTADLAVGVSGGDAAATATWTCTSSDTGTAAVAVSATGCLVTGVGGGNVTIVASVTKGTETSHAAAALTVTAVSTGEPPSVTIAAINQGPGAPPGGSPIGAPVNILAAGGQMDVVINIDRGTLVLQRIDLLVDNVVVASQVFAAAAAAADGPAEQNTQQVTLSFDSACYTNGAAGAACGTVNAVAGTAVARHLNGPRGISARLQVAGAVSQISSNTVTLMLANVSGFHVAAASLPATSVTDAAGVRWYGGPTATTTSFTAVPVIYTGGTVSSVTTTFCGTTAAPDTTAPYSSTFSCVGFSDVNPLSGLPGTASAPTFTSAIAGNPGPVRVINAAAAGFPIRIDNVAPTNPPTFIGNPNVRQNGRIDGAVVLTGLNALPAAGNATPDGWMVNGAVCVACAAGVFDFGVGGYTRMLRVGASTPGGTVDAARTATPSASPALPAPSVANTAYCGISSARDALGNETALPASGTLCLPPPGAVSQVATSSTHIQFGVAF